MVTGLVDRPRQCITLGKHHTVPYGTHTCVLMLTFMRGREKARSTTTTRCLEATVVRRLTDSRFYRSQIKAFSAAALGLSQPVTLADFPARVFEAMQPFLSCDYCAYHEFTKFTPVRSVVSPAYRPDLQALVEFLDQHPSITNTRAQKLNSSVKISDFLTLSKWRRTDLYNHLFRPENQNYQLAFITTAPDVELGPALNRSCIDFTEEERQLLDLIRPHLIRAFHNSRLLSELARGNKPRHPATRKKFSVGTHRRSGRQAAILFDR